MSYRSFFFFLERFRVFAAIKPCECDLRKDDQNELAGRWFVEQRCWCVLVRLRVHFVGGGDRIERLLLVPLLGQRQFSVDFHFLGRSVAESISRRGHGKGKRWEEAD